MAVIGPENGADFCCCTIGSLRASGVLPATMKPLDPSVRQSLRQIKVHGPDVDLSYFPDFLLIGPQRTGTTWLHANLEKHPQIFMAEPKELYYFSTLKYPDVKPVGAPTITSLEEYLAFFRPTSEELAKRDARCRAAYGEPSDIGVRGEATASNAAGLDAEIMNEIVSLNPDIRAVLLVRNPIERAWSHAKKDTSRDVGRDIKEVPASDLREFFSSYYQRKCGQYTEIIGAWESVLKDGHLFVGGFDEIMTDPASLLLRLFEFLGVRAESKYVSSDLSERQINATQKSRIPEELRELLVELHGDELARLAERGFTWPDSQAGTP